MDESSLRRSPTRHPDAVLLQKATTLGLFLMKNQTRTFLFELFTKERLGCEQ